MPRSDGRGTQHARRPHAIGGAIGGAIGRAIGVAVLAAATLATPLTGPLRAQNDPFVQRGVTGEATAENAVVAQERAMAAARRAAYARMAAATGRSASASDSQIESQVLSMVVESGRSTRNGYSGSYTVRFRGAGRVQSAGPPTPAPDGSAPAAAPRPPPTRDPSDAAYVPPAAGGTPAGLPRVGAMTAYLDAATRFNSINEWLDLRRRLLADPAVGSVDIVSISTEGARLRLGLRGPPPVAAEELSARGILLAQVPSGAAGGPSVWRVGLAGGT